MLDFDSINIELSRMQCEADGPAHEPLVAGRLRRDFHIVNRPSEYGLHPRRLVVERAHELTGEF